MATWAIILLAAWGALVLLSRHVHRIDPRGDLITGLALLALRLHARLLMRTRVHGAEHIPQGKAPGPLIVVCNHTGGVDPLLVQSACDFEIRWMMGQDMMLPELEPIWSWTRVIGVNRTGRDIASTREALRHLKANQVLGIFPEGRIERPPNHLLPFEPGAGFLIARSGAPVLPVWIRGTPYAEQAWGSLYRPGRVHLVFGPLMHFAKDSKPEEVVAKLEDWFRQTSGW
ncbi:MAG: hypothetical protein GC200_08155 [Tepidisphaera sp.]|nr:hypothetical protein [Tepidisphaera sp.]